MPMPFNQSKYLYWKLVSSLLNIQISQYIIYVKLSDYINKWIYFSFLKPTYWNRHFQNANIKVLATNEQFVMSYCQISIIKCFFFLKLTKWNLHFQIADWKVLAAKKYMWHVTLLQRTQIWVQYHCFPEPTGPPANTMKRGIILAAETQTCKYAWGSWSIVTLKPTQISRYVQLLHKKICNNT